jgi:hypothetical protein
MAPSDPFVHKVPSVYSSEGSKRNVYTALCTIEYTALCTVLKNTVHSAWPGVKARVATYHSSSVRRELLSPLRPALRHVQLVCYVRQAAQNDIHIYMYVCMYC